MHGLSSDLMHGSIFIFLKRYIENRHDYSTWIRILESENIERVATPYQMTEVYPVSELYTILAAGALAEGVPYPEFQQDFGEFLVPDLLLVFKKFVNPDWKTYEMLQHIGSHMHSGIKRESAQTNPPPLHVTKVGKNMLVIDYHSKRRMAGFAIGIIKGLARYFHESDKVKVMPATDLLSERVQIRVEFTTNG
ncbi:heme NO-binding domain-containing protein [Pontibacter litorisediminis]|uniref:heme NO-binding domain-containing protein n=1 Tax=Pontibacter litorisediminis TaxID=1846260 RepID=UPI0023ED129F|nr:heme NO-binding domain-containing protein [Pontibacter litorisediminis]